MVCPPPGLAPEALRHLSLVPVFTQVKGAEGPTSKSLAR